MVEKTFGNVGKAQTFFNESNKGHHKKFKNECHNY
jgi:hypothetical protein